MGPAAIRDEARMRADESKIRRYERLIESPYFTGVVEVSRAYLAAAVTDPARTERDHWALSCLPGSSRALSRTSMGSMETLALFRTGPDAMTGVEGFVIVVRSVLEKGFGSAARFGRAFPAVRATACAYRDAGEDQVRVSGRGEDLVAALADRRFARAARVLAEALLPRHTMHWRGHSYLLADHVLGRT